MRQILVSFALWWFVALAVATTSPLVPIASIPGTSLSVYASLYDRDILRLVVKPSEEWSFEVPHVIVPEPSNDNIQPTCDGAECKILYGNCLAQVDVKEHVLVTLTCNGVHITTSTIYPADFPKAHVKFEFPAAKTMYGLAEHAADLPLRPNKRYEMFNTDAFQYQVNSTEGLYGSIPFIMAYSAAATTGVLFLNSAEMSVSVLNAAVPSCDWEAEVGRVDLFLLPGPTPAKVQQQHAFLTGATLLPPYFSLGFHQCRWNYMNTNDCLAVDEGFDKHIMPYDVLWLDIEHTDRKKYFTWDQDSFPDPTVLTDALASKGRKLVTVKDPHIKYQSGYHAHDEAIAGNHCVLDPSGTEPYTGSCWPGLSTWPDFLNERTRNWYGTLFHEDRYPGGGRDTHTWVDMNEPSVFNGPRKTMAKEMLHVMDDGRKLEHRYIHNMYSLLSIMAVYTGTTEARGPTAKKERHFILTRSFFPGSQRYAAMWNGDNMARWSHLQNTVPELLSLSVSNYPFCGADIGGFFYNPEEELFVRWMQSGVFYPFLRSHAHLETKRREPWTFSVDAQHHIRNALALRYSLIPYLYTTFYHGHMKGDTILRPLIYEFPQQEALREEQSAFMFGPSLLVRPVMEKGATSVTVPLPEGTVWYAYASGEAVHGGSGHLVPVQLDTIPLFVRGGHIVPVKLRLRRSTFAARFDPFTLFIALTPQGNSGGDLYVDDGATFDYMEGQFAHRQFTFSNGRLTCRSHPNSTTGKEYRMPNTVERIVIYGYQGKPSLIYHGTKDSNGVEQLGKPLEYERVGTSIIIRKPDLEITADWDIFFSNT